MPFLFTYVSLQLLFFTSLSFFLRNMWLSILIIYTWNQHRHPCIHSYKTPTFSRQYINNKCWQTKHGQNIAFVYCYHFVSQENTPLAAYFMFGIFLKYILLYFLYIVQTLTSQFFSSVHWFSVAISFVCTLAFAHNFFHLYTGSRSQFFSSVHWLSLTISIICEQALAHNLYHLYTGSHSQFLSSVHWLSLTISFIFTLALAHNFFHLYTGSPSQFLSSVHWLWLTNCIISTLALAHNFFHLHTGSNSQFCLDNRERCKRQSSAMCCNHPVQIINVIP